MTEPDSKAMAHTAGPMKYPRPWTIEIEQGVLSVIDAGDVPFVVVSADDDAKVLWPLIVRAVNAYLANEGAAKTECCRQYAKGLPLCDDCPAASQPTLAGKECFPLDKLLSEIALLTGYDKLTLEVVAQEALASQPKEPT